MLSVLSGEKRDTLDDERWLFVAFGDLSLTKSDMLRNGSPYVPPC